jgi:hypothetical protein
MTECTELTLNMKNVEARYLLWEIERTLCRHEERNVSDSLVSVLNNIYKGITGRECPEGTQPHLDLNETVSVDSLPIKSEEKKSLLNWARSYLFQFDSGSNDNIIFGKAFNDIFKGLVGIDYPGFIEKYDDNYYAYANRIVKNLSLPRVNPEYIEVWRKELETLLDYLKENKLKAK